MTRTKRAKAKLAQATGKTGSGKPCITDFTQRANNPANKRRSPWRGCAK